MPVDIYDLLASQDVSATTLTQLDSAIKNTSIDRTNTKFWNGPITVYRTIEASRTYPMGNPIPEASAVDIMTIADGATDTLKPTTPGLFQLVSIFSSAAVSLQLVGTGGTTLLSSLSGGAVFLPTYPFILTPTLYLQVANASGGEATVSIAYHTVGL
jgi:hypothetical protein